jgi:hypothetical protein
VTKPASINIVIATSFIAAIPHWLRRPQLLS